MLSYQNVLGRVFHDETDLQFGVLNKEKTGSKPPFERRDTSSHQSPKEELSDNRFIVSDVFGHLKTCQWS